MSPSEWEKILKDAQQIGSQGHIVICECDGCGQTTEDHMFMSVEGGYLISPDTFMMLLDRVKSDAWQDAEAFLKSQKEDNDED